MTPSSILAEIIRRARRRYISNEVLAEVAYAGSLAMGGAIFLLLIGSQLLDWRWIALITVAGFSVGVYRTSRRIPSHYQLAQRIDRRLDLHDCVATAFFFNEVDPSRPISSDLRTAQLHEAERLVPSIVLAQAFPFTVPRATYAFAALGLIASSLFALRYGLERRLDLRQPLTRVVFDSLGWSPELQLASIRKKFTGRKPEQPKPVGLSVDEHGEENSGRLESAPDSALETSETPDVDNTNAENPSKKSKGSAPGSEQAEGERSEGSAEDNANDSASAGNSSAGAAGERQGKGERPTPGKQDSNFSSENSSLMAKLRDAMSSLLSKRSQSNGGSQPSSDSKNGGSKGQQAGAGQKGAATQGQQAGGQQSSEAQDGQAGDDAENGQNAEGKGSGKSSEQQASKAPGSGIGSQDGSKDVKLAEQLAAMGKISEIIGKRSANITGEMTIEVQSGKQQLRTPYSASNATHAEAGGEINRDEVPVVYQQYVQQYFEQMRKQTTDGGARKPK